MRKEEDLARRLEILKAHFPLDEEKKLFEVSLHYEKAEELLQKDLSSIDRPYFRPEVIDRIDEVISDIPKGYDAEIKFCVKDYQGYDPRMLDEAFNEAIELNSYRHKDEYKRKGLMAFGLILLGALIILFDIIGSARGWFGESDQFGNILTGELLSIAGWVCVLEGVSICFLSPNQSRIVNMRILYRIRKIDFCREDGEIIEGAEVNDLVRKLSLEYRSESLGKGMLLFAGAAFFALAFHGVVVLIYELIDIFSGQIPQDAIGLEVASIILIAVTLILQITGGITAISYFLGREGLWHHVVMHAFLILAFLIAEAIISAFAEDVSSTVGSVFGIIVDVVYLVAVSFIYITRKNLERKGTRS